MKFLRGKMGMLTILLLIIMKGTDGPPVRILPNTRPPVTPNIGPPVRILPNTVPLVTKLPNTGPTVIIINACAGENKQLMTKDESAQEDIITSHWIFSKGIASITTNNVIYCQMEISGRFIVNPLYSSKVEQCEATSILLKNLSLHDMGYYTLHSLKEKIGSTESLPIFLSVSDTPAKQCKPVIRSHSGNMLNCSTQCEQFDVEWRLNKGGDVVGNESILPVDCLWKNESILCCLKSKDMECYKGDRFDLCAQITPSYCTENRPGENVHDVHADKAPDNPGSDMLGLLALPALLIILGITVIYVRHRKKILSFPTMCRDTCKSIPGRSVSTQESHADLNDVQVPEETVPILTNDQKPHADDNDVQVPEETVPMLTNDQKPHADDNDVQVPETPSPILGTVQELDADVKLDQMKEKTFPILHADGQQVQQQEITSPMLDVGQELVADVQHTQKQDPVHETEEAGTEHQPNSETTNEIQELRHAAMCKICFTRRMSVLFLPCKHIATCDNCCSALENCPVCRTLIDEKIKNIRYD